MFFHGHRMRDILEIQIPGSKTLKGNIRGLSSLGITKSAGPILIKTHHHI